MKAALLSKLTTTISSLSEPQLKRLDEFIGAITKPISENVNPSSDILNSAFCEEFRSRLLTQHAFQDSPLFQDTFDAAFVQACKTAQQSVTLAPDGCRFWDVRVGEKTYSLKSSKAKGLKVNTLHISKLCEAAWIQDCRNATRRQAETRKLFSSYISAVTSILQLRYFRNEKKYELVEIPVALFEPILSVPRDYFDSDGPTINIPIGQKPPDLSISLDRSDAKITIKNILKSKCFVHGTWVLPSDPSPLTLGAPSRSADEEPASDED